MNPKIRINIEKTVEDIDDSTLEKLEEVLQEAGVKKLSDLDFIEEADLRVVLNKVNSRKLVNGWLKPGQNCLFMELLKIGSSSSHSQMVV